MPVMHLIARVPNEGARRLAWVIGQSDDPAIAIRRIEARLGVNTVERLLDGTLLPSLKMGSALHELTGEQLTAGDFYREAQGWWFDPFNRRRSAHWKMPMPGRVAERGDWRRRRAKAGDPEQASA